MKLFRIDSDCNGSQWIGSRAEARQGGAFEQVEVPTDKPGLIAFLNQLAATVPAPVAKPPTAPPAELRGVDARRRQMLEASVTNDAVVELILNSEGWQLERMVNAVIDRMREMGKAAGLKAVA